jgi:hypothetical protein
MRREPGTDLDLTTVLDKRRHDTGPGRYESLHLVGEIEGVPVLTFTAPDPAVLRRNPPSEPYLATIAKGLRQSHGLSDAAICDYLHGRPGMQPEWDRERVAAVVSGARVSTRAPRGARPRR